jgi:hypothetical protein
MGGVSPLSSHLLLSFFLTMLVCIHHRRLGKVWVKGGEGEKNDDGESRASHRLCTHACHVQPAARLIPNVLDFDPHITPIIPTYF